jgi:hypothetical protein
VKSRKKSRRTSRGKARILARIRRNRAGSAIDARGRVMQVVRTFPGIFFYDRPYGCQALHAWGEISLRGRDMVSDKQALQYPRMPHRRRPVLHTHHMICLLARDVQYFPRAPLSYTVACVDVGDLERPYCTVAGLVHVASRPDSDRGKSPRLPTVTASTLAPMRGGCPLPMINIILYRGPLDVFFDLMSSHCTGFSF